VRVAAAVSTSLFLAAQLTVPVLGQDARRALDLMNRGQWEQAEETLERSVTRDALSLRLGIELHQRRGAVEDARSVSRRLLDMYSTGLLETPGEVAHAAYAAWVLQDWEAANRIFIRAAEMPGAPPSLFVDWGNLYLEKYNPAEAESIFRDGLRAEFQEVERWSLSDLYLGLSRALHGQNRPGASEALEEAAKADPGNPALLAQRALLAIQKEDLEEASALVEKGLGEVPGYPPLMELGCAVAFFHGEGEDFPRCEEQLLEINPRNGDLYELLGDLCVVRRRLEDAVRFYDRAVQLNPRQWSALAAKGMNLLRLGEESEGVAALERAYANDPYNVWTVNTLRLVDSFSRFELFETPRFSVRLHQNEAAVLRPYVEDLLDRSLTTLEERYGHRVEHRVVFEMYPDHEDFAVRTLGLPGLGALGAAFGRVVAMDSPSARPKGTFHWASTLWHEVAHVVTLSLSRNRVPRWFTEGLSMMEERTGGPGWGDGLSLSFVRAYLDGRLLPLDDLNSGFVRPETPEQIALSYYQAGWVCEVIADRFGMEKIRAMLRAYGEGLDTDEVFAQVLGKSVAEVDTLFRDELARVLDPFAPRLVGPDSPTDDEASLRSAVGNNPESFFLHWALGQMLAEKGNPDEAVSFLERARNLFPYATAENGPYGLLARIHLEREDFEAAREILWDWWHRHPLFVDNALQLGRLLTREGRSDEALQVLEQAVYSDPFSAPLHRMLGDLYLDSGRNREAVRTFAVLLELDPRDRAAAHFGLAKALLRAGERERARREVLLSLEIAPGYEEAQRLLLEMVRQ
jgi:cellulose synthase operon protein C